MFLEALQAFQTYDGAAWHVPIIFLSLGILLLAWRAWTFTVKPALYPQSPKELPYWIPWLGHAPAFVSDGQAVLRKGRLYFENSRLPFFLTLGGQRIYVLTAPEDVASMYKDTESFTFDKAVADLTFQFGVSKQSCNIFYQKPSSEDDDPAAKAGYQNPGLESIAHLNNDHLKLQLHPGAQYNDLVAKLTKLIHDWTSPERLRGSMIIGSPSYSKTRTVSFYRWAQDVLLQVSSRAIFGPGLLDESPNLFADFLRFDDENWRLWYKIPGSQAVIDAKNRVVDAFVKYISIPREARPGMAPVIDMYERTKRARGIPERDIATVLSMLYLVSNTNNFKLCFWIMAHLLHNPNALEMVRKEIKPAFKPDTNEADVQYLLNSCPFFNAVFDETLRLCSATASIRTTTKPVTVSGKLIPAGAQILCPFRELHWNTDVWGQDPSVWDPSRFIQHRTLNRSPSYRPFGGGSSYCPGRFIARTEALLFIALALQRFDVELQPGQSFPEYDRKPNPALMAPAAGHDLIVRVTEKVY